MKVAIVHEWFDTYAGSERVIEQLLAIWPDADLFALVDFLPDAERGFLRVLADQSTEARLRGPTGIAYRHSSFIVASYDNKKVLIFNSSAPARSSAVLIDSRFSSQPSPLPAHHYM